MPGVQDNAEQVREKAFQSMQDSLDKIEKNTSSLGVLSGTIEEIMEENKAQRVRDKEQEKQTDALEKISKNSKEGMSTWKKVLVGVLGLGIGIWTIYDLMKGRWPKIKDLDPALDEKKRKKALEEMMKNPWGTLKNAMIDSMDPNKIGKPGSTEALFPQAIKVGVGVPPNIKNQATRFKQWTSDGWKNWKPGAGEKWQRGKERFQRFKAGFVIPEGEAKERARGNKARETLGKADKIRQSLLDKEDKARKLKEETQRKANTAKKMSALKAEGEQQRKEAKSRDNLNKATKTQGAEAEKNRLRQIREGRGRPVSSSRTTQQVSQARFPLGTDGKPRVDPLKTAKGNVRQGVNYVRSMAKGWTVFRTVGAVPIPGARFVAAVLSMGLIAADTWAQTEEGQLFLKELRWSKEQFLEELFEKGKKAKSFTSAPLDAARIPKKQVDSMEGKLSTGTGTSDPLSKIGSNIKKRFTKLGKFLWGKEDKPLVLKMTKPYSGTDDESLTDADFNAIRIPIGKRESEGAEGGQLRAKNKYGYRGKYQFGAQALESIGFLKAGTWKKGPRNNKKLMENSSNWIGGTDKDGNPLPKSLNAYLSSEEMQDLAFHKNALFNRKVMRGKGGIGMETWNTLSKEERAFMVGAAHISGAQSTVSQFNRGDFGKKDAFGTESSVMGNIAARAVNKTGQALQSIRAEMGGTGSGGATQVNINAPTSSNASNVLVFGNGPHAPAIDNGLSFGFKGQMDTSKGN